MKIVLSILLFFFLELNFSIAQLPIQWQHPYGGSSDDGAADIQPAVNGGFVFCGWAESTDQDVSNPLGGSDFWLVRIDSQGNIVWDNNYGGNSSEYALSMVTASDGYVLAGYTYSNDGQVVGEHGDFDFWAMKADTAGNFLWGRTYGGSNRDQLNNIQKTSDGNYIMSGWTESIDGDITNNHGIADIWVVKINDTGAIIWQRTYGGSDLDVFGDIQNTSDNGYVIAGYSGSADGDATVNRGVYDAWIVKVNDTGGIQWQKSYGGSGGDGIDNIQQTADGGYIALAYTFSNDGDVTGFHGGSGGDIWIFKTDSTGTLQWEKTYGGTHDDEGVKIQAASGGGYVFLGSTSSPDGDVTDLHGDTTDYWLVKIDDTGKIIWQKTYGGSMGDGAQAFMQLTDSNYLIAGVTRSNNGDVYGNHGLGDAWVLLVGNRNTEQATTVGNDDNIRVYPTLSSGVVHAVLPHSVTAPKISLINMLGQQVATTEEVNGNEHTLHITDAAAGMYLLQVTVDGWVSNYKIMYER